MSNRDAATRSFGRRRITCASLALIAFARVIPATAGASQRSSAPGGTCFAELADVKITYDAGTLFGGRSFRFSFTGIDNPCVMSDPSIRSATEIGRSAGRLNCSTPPTLGYESGIDTFRWSNGRSSVVAYTDTVSVLGGSITRGVVIRGEFKGLRIYYQGVPVPGSLNSLDICTSPKPGTIDAEFVGFGNWGASAGSTP